MHELIVPSAAHQAESAVEVARIWVTDKTNQFAIEPYWKDSGHWGVLIADLIHQVSQAYAHRGQDPDVVFKRILEVVRAELESPTDFPESTP